MFQWERQVLAMPANHTKRPRARWRDTPRQALARFAVAFLLTLTLTLALGGGAVWLARGGPTPPAPTPAPTPTAAPTPAPTPTPTPLRVELSGLNSQNALLIERGGTELGSLTADAPIYPASMTKIMTVLLGIENLPDLEAAVTLDADIYTDLWAENASMAGFHPGETVTVRDILYGSLLPSGAECSVTIARLVDGSVEAFAARMNDRAAALGLTGTHFVNPTGLHDPQQVSTVRDIARLLDAALENPAFRELFTTQSYTTTPTDVHPDGLLLHSVMFAMLDGETAPGVTLLGGKTGFTDQAGQCLASLAACGGKEYILVTAGAPGDNSTGDYQHIRDALTVYTRLARAAGAQ